MPKIKESSFYKHFIGKLKEENKYLSKKISKSFLHDEFQYYEILKYSNNEGPIITIYFVVEVVENENIIHYFVELNDDKACYPVSQPKSLTKSFYCDILEDTYRIIFNQDAKLSIKKFEKANQSNFEILTYEENRGYNWKKPTRSNNEAGENISTFLSNLNNIRAQQQIKQAENTKALAKNEKVKLGPDAISNSNPVIAQNSKKLEKSLALIKRSLNNPPEEKPINIYIVPPKAPKIKILPENFKKIADFIMKQSKNNSKALTKSQLFKIDENGKRFLELEINSKLSRIDINYTPKLRNNAVEVFNIENNAEAKHKAILEQKMENIKSKLPHTTYLKKLPNNRKKKKSINVNSNDNEIPEEIEGEEEHYANNFHENNSNNIKQKNSVSKEKNRPPVIASNIQTIQKPIIKGNVFNNAISIDNAEAKHKAILEQKMENIKSKLPHTTYLKKLPNNRKKKKSINVNSNDNEIPEEIEGEEEHYANNFHENNSNNIKQKNSVSKEKNRPPVIASNIQTIQKPIIKGNVFNNAISIDNEEVIGSSLINNTSSVALPQQSLKNAVSYDAAANAAAKTIIKILKKKFSEYLVEQSDNFFVLKYKKLNPSNNSIKNIMLEYNSKDNYIIVQGKQYNYTKTLDGNYLFSSVIPSERVFIIIMNYGEIYIKRDNQENKDMRKLINNGKNIEWKLVDFNIEPYRFVYNFFNQENTTTYEAEVKAAQAQLPLNSKQMISLQAKITPPPNTSVKNAVKPVVSSIIKGAVNKIAKQQEQEKLELQKQSNNKRRKNALNASKSMMSGIMTAVGKKLSAQPESKIQTTNTSQTQIIQGEEAKVAANAKAVAEAKVAANAKAAANAKVAANAEIAAKLKKETENAIIKKFESSINKINTIDKKNDLNAISNQINRNWDLVNNIPKHNPALFSKYLNAKSKIENKKRGPGPKIQAEIINNNNPVNSKEIKVPKQENKSLIGKIGNFVGKLNPLSKKGYTLLPNKNN